MRRLTGIQVVIMPDDPSPQNTAITVRALLTGHTLNCLYLPIAHEDLSRAAVSSLELAQIGSGNNLSYIEHIFEISRRPDLLTRVIEYRTTVLKISEDDEIDTKLTRIPSAKKYKDLIRAAL
ncbi:unnamed protein product [Gadus morhua 'NCC']